MLRIEQTYLIRATPEQVWQALTDAAMMRQWSGQPAAFDPQPGGRYQLFGDYVTGQVVEIDAPNKLAQTWKPQDWTVEDSVVTFLLTPTAEGTRVELIHENVQPEDYEGTSRGWDESYVGAVKTILEAETAAPPEKRATSKRAARKTAKGKPATRARAKTTSKAKLATAKRAAARKRATTPKRGMAKRVGTAKRGRTGA